MRSYLPTRSSRSGITMLEIIIAGTLLTTAVTAVSVVMRGAQSAWAAHLADYSKYDAAQGVVRHLVRNIRQADSVVSITAPATTAGSLTLLMASGSQYVWTRNGSTNEVNFGVGSATNLLGEGITELSFTAYKADGTTTTTTASEVQLIKVTAKVQVVHDSTITRTISSYAWVRAY